MFILQLPAPEAARKALFHCILNVSFVFCIPFLPRLESFSHIVQLCYFARWKWKSHLFDMGVFWPLTYISAAAASPSPGDPALSSPSLSPCGRRGRTIRPHSRWRYQKQHEDGHSSAGWLQPEHESLSPWEKTNQTVLYYRHCAIWTDAVLWVLNVAQHNIWYHLCCCFSLQSLIMTFHVF